MSKPSHQNDEAAAFRTLQVGRQRGHIGKIVEGLLASGWNLKSIPADARLPRNRPLLVLSTVSTDHRFRIMAYKVTTSGRGRPHERRIEITTTFQSGLNRIRGVQDIVIGYDEASQRFVGVDSKRLSMGGTTHNASSFFDREGLAVRAGEMLVNPRLVTSNRFASQVEYHAFFDGSRLAEYLLNHREIHDGSYGFNGAWRGRRRLRALVAPLATEAPAKGSELVLEADPSVKVRTARVTERALQAVEERDFAAAGRKISPEQLKQIMSMCDEIGALGEQVVLSEERSRLRRLGHVAQAERVERVSLKSVGEGFDILSFEDDGLTRRYVEVKSTTRKGTVVDVTATEWRAAQRLRERYYIARVTEVRSAPRVQWVRDPAELDRTGRVTRTASGWRLELRAASAPSLSEE